MWERSKVSSVGMRSSYWERTKLARTKKSARGGQWDFRITGYYKEKNIFVVIYKKSQRTHNFVFSLQMKIGKRWEAGGIFVNGIYCHFCSATFACLIFLFIIFCISFSVQLFLARQNSWRGDLVKWSLSDLLVLKHKTRHMTSMTIKSDTGLHSQSLRCLCSSVDIFVNDF